MSDPLLPHLLDIASDPTAEGLILAGGFGMRVKQAYLQEIGAQTLIPEVPTARATQDLDFFLRMELFLRPEKGRAVRTLLDDLDYKPNKDNANWQFEKRHDPIETGRLVKVDLLARSPRPEEAISSDGRRVGKNANMGIHGGMTKEAFAIEDRPLHVSVGGRRSDGENVTVGVCVAHPYAMLQMKIKAAYDWLRRAKYKEGSEKHAFDIYVLTAMLTEKEIIECADLATQYMDNMMASDHRLYAEELFGTRGAPGFAEAVRQARQGGWDIRSNHDTFIEALRMVTGSPT